MPTGNENGLIAGIGDFGVQDLIDQSTQNAINEAHVFADQAAAAAQLVGNVVNRELQILPVKAGSAMNIGTPVYISSADGTNIIVSPASSATEATSSKVLGLLMQTLANNGQGSVVTGGKLAGLNTSAATLGDAVWLGNTAGALIFGLTNKPKAPQHLVSLGVVSRVHATNGEITVRIQNGFEFDEIHNYLESNLQDGDIVQYDAVSGLYKNVGIARATQNKAPAIAVQKDITATLQEGFLIPDYSYPEANANYRIATYLVEAGKIYRLVATITTPARANGSGGAYCLYNNFDTPSSGGIITQPQLSTKNYDVLITVPAGVTYIRVTQKIAGDSNALSEVITTPNLVTSIANEKSNILDYLIGVALVATIQDGIVLWNTTSAIGNSNYKALFFPVIAGKKYRVKGQFTTPDKNNANIAFYCFFTGATYTAGIAETLVSQNVTTKAYDIVVTAPSTATFIGISQLKNVDAILVNEVIQQSIGSPSLIKAIGDIESSASKIEANKAKIEANTALLSRQISAVYRNGYVIPNYLWEEEDASYKVAKYPVEEGKTYRLQAQVTSKSVAQGTMGAYCWFSQLEVPITGQITVQPQLATKTYDVVLTPPSGAKYLCVSQKITGGDYNTFVELISTSSLKLKLDTISSDNVTCWGDSITWGSAPEDGNYWTKLLQQAIGTSKTVVNCGVGGEGAVNIPMRQGAIPMYNSVEFSLPANTNTIPVGRMDNWIYNGFFKSSYNDEPCSFLLQGEGRDFNTINPCFVDGIECTLSYVRESTNPEQGQYYIKRNTAGTARTIKIGTPVITNAAKTLKQDSTVLFMGTNDGWIDANDLIARYKKMVEFADVGKKYVIVGIYGGVAKTNHNLNKIGFEALEKAMLKEFGSHFINLRKYCVEQGLLDAGITPTTADNNAMALGDMPPSLLADSVHPNTAGSILIKNLIYSRLQQLGIL